MDSDQPTVSFGGKTFPLKSFPEINFVSVQDDTPRHHNLLSTKDVTVVIPIDPEVMRELFPQLLIEPSELLEIQKLPLVNISPARINQILGY